ncbi:MAG TPA: enoyl-CoA hydratase/isomerase family protein [Limnochorda sp.]
MADPVRLAVEDGVARITIARPAVRNALNRATCRALVEALTQAGEHPSVRVILLRGEGEEAFCAGADLGELAELQARGDVLAIRELFSGVAECILALEESPVPVVGMVIGHALGGGLGLAAACDILYVADDARLGLPELGVGLFPMVVMAPILRSVGRKRALELIFSAGTIDGAEAARIGLATRAFPRAELQPATEQLLERVAAFRPEILRLGRKAVARTDGLGLREAVPWLLEAGSVVAASDAARHGVAAFVERRAARSGSGEVSR